MLPLISVSPLPPIVIVRLPPLSVLLQKLPLNDSRPPPCRLFVIVEALLPPLTGAAGGPKIITFVIDGELHDGGERRQFGWARFPRELRTVAFGEKLALAPKLRGEMKSVRFYNRALRTTEVIGNFRAGAR